MKRRVVKNKRKPSIKSLEQIACPKCGQGHLLKGKSAFGCSRYAEGCDMRLSFAEYDPSLTPAKLNKLIAKQYVSK